MSSGPTLVCEQTGDTFEIPGQGCVIGREEGCDLVLADATVSRRHARITLAAEGHRLIDLASRNGTFVNGGAIQSSALEDGDHIRFGDRAFRFRTGAPAPVGRTKAAPATQRLTVALEALWRLSADIPHLPTENAMTNVATVALCDFLKADRATVALVSREGTLDIADVNARPESQLAGRAAVPRALMEASLRESRPLKLAPATEHETADGVRAHVLGSTVVAPLVAQGRGLGSLLAERFGPPAEPFDEVDLLVCEIVANLLATSVDTLRTRAASGHDRSGRFSMTQMLIRPPEVT